LEKDASTRIAKDTKIDPSETIIVYQNSDKKIPIDTKGFNKIISECTLCDRNKRNLFALHDILAIHLDRMSAERIMNGESKRVIMRENCGTSNSRSRISKIT